MRGSWSIGGVLVPAALLLVLAGPLAPSLGQGEERGKIGTAGGEGGEEFKDKHLPKGARVIGVRIRSGDWIDSVELLYKTADGKTEGLGRHGGDGGDEHTFLLDDDEYIKGISGKAGPYVMSLTIITSKRKSKQFGLGDGEKAYNFVAPGDEVIGFYGRSGDYVDQIGIYVRKKQ